ncbi:hypothetical protein MHB71_04880 [Paenibacillus sp. FSL H7-0940]|uniref:hypothetical protein n=1 Tax=Paenibacillus sp. FSL H7-0940 TaxID=2921443 RepID=UPI0030EE4B4B
MAKGKINMPTCPKCGKESGSKWCFHCHCHTELVTRDKCQVSGDFRVVDWFSSRSSAGLIVEDTVLGQRYSLYMADVFDFFKGTRLSSRTLEETNKGSGYGWKVIN